MLAGIHIVRTAGQGCQLAATAARNSIMMATRGLSDKAKSEKPAQGKLAVVPEEQRKPLAPADEYRDLQEIKPNNRGLFYPEQMEWLDERLVRISKPTKNVMQSGTAYTSGWKIEFNSQTRYEYPLMGWTGSNDPVSNMTLTFPTKEAAIEYCERNELQWFVEDQPERKIRRKSYADNFAWNKRTRLSNK